MPFEINLSDGTTVVVDEVLRTIPKRRLVGYGTWKGESIVVKLFFDPKRAKIHAEKDAKGVMNLQKIKIPTPPLLFQGVSQDKKTYILIFARVFDAQTLDALWWNRQSDESLYTRLQAVMVELATQHVYGIIQHDLHLKNFLLTEKVIYTLDGGQVELHPNKLDKKASMENIALFLSQLGVGVKTLQEHLFRFYAASRGWIIKEDDIRSLFDLIEQWNKKRWRSYQRKIGRNATDFQKIDLWNKQGMVYREYATPAFFDFLKNPDAIFLHPSSEVLKAGRSSTVIKAIFDDRTVVIKRYNLKNWLHRARRLLRATRAACVWRLAHKLNLFGVKTAKPIAYFEYNIVGFRGRSYYLTEYIAGHSLIDYLTTNKKNTDKTNNMLERVSHLISCLPLLNMTHGDLKASNILVNQQVQPILIDLDGAQEHLSMVGLQRSYKKDIKRFLENFKEYPVWNMTFKQLLD